MKLREVVEKILYPTSGKQFNSSYQIAPFTNDAYLKKWKEEDKLKKTKEKKKLKK